MDVTVTEYLLALAREGSLTKAAEPFFISPSALSQRLAREEKEVGFPLFRREGGRFLPTREGAVYLRYAQEILTVKQETYQQIARLSSRAVSLRIASSPQFFQAVSEELLPQLQKEFPDARFDLQPADSHVVRHWLLNGLADMGLLCLLSTGDSLLEQVTLGTDRLAAAVPDVLLSPGQENVSLEDLRELPFILLREGSSFRTLENEILSERGLYPGNVYEAEDFLVARDLMRAGTGIALLPESMIRPGTGCRLLSLSPSKPYYRILAYPKYAAPNRESQAFHRLCLSFFSKRAYNKEEANGKHP